MNYQVSFSDYSVKKIKKFSKVGQSKLKHFITSLLPLDSPRKVGKSLSGTYKGHWRYRADKMRILCIIVDDPNYVIKILDVDYRGNIYK